MAALDFPNPPLTVGQLYNGTNGVTYQWDGTVWTVPVGGAQLWSVSGSVLTPTDATKNVAIPGVAGAAAGMILGANLTKARFQTSNASAVAYAVMSTNRDTISGAQDDATKPSWSIVANSNSDNATIGRAPAGGALVNLLTLSNSGDVDINTGVPGYGAGMTLWGYMGTNTWSAVYRCKTSRGTAAAPTPSLLNDSIAQYEAQGCNTAGQNFAVGGLLRFTCQENWSTNAHGTNFQVIVTNIGASSAAVMFTFDPAGNFLIPGSTGQKASGTTWSNPSDPRLKNDIAPYAAGLDEILALEPISYRLKAQPDGPLCYGFDAEKVRDVFPECVTTTRMKLDPADEEETDDVLVFDMHPILVALVNAMKDVGTRLAALEAR